MSGEPGPERTGRRRSAKRAGHAASGANAAFHPPLGRDQTPALPGMEHAGDWPGPSIASRPAAPTSALSPPGAAGLTDLDGLRLTDAGLFCPAADVHIDPWRPVDRAIITHAHSDHARPGCGGYLCAPTCEPLLRARLGQTIRVQTVPWGRPLTLGDATVSLHPAGHVRGSAQVRVQIAGRVTVVTGDFKLAPDPSAESFEPVTAHTLICESTFGLPVYRWPATDAVIADLVSWWRAAAAAGLTALLCTYALGKAQRVLAELALLADRGPLPGPIALHGAVEPLTAAYRGMGVTLAPTQTVAALRDSIDVASRKRRRQARLPAGTLVIAPPSALGSAWTRSLGPVSTAFASGWMAVRGARRRRNVDAGLVLSDHADWPGLLSAIAAARPERVGVTHGFTAPLTRFLREVGPPGLGPVDAFELTTRFEGEGAEEPAVDAVDAVPANAAAAPVPGSHADA